MTDPEVERLVRLAKKALETESKKDRDDAVARLLGAALYLYRVTCEANGERSYEPNSESGL